MYDSTQRQGEHYFVHPDFGLQKSWNATLFGEIRPPFDWMCLSTSEQRKRASEFYRALLSAIAAFPSLSVTVTYTDHDSAAAVALPTSDLLIDGRTVSGPVTANSLANFAHKPWQSISITSRSQPLLTSVTSDLSNLWLDAQDAAELRAALDPVVLTAPPAASRGRARWAAFLVALHWLLLVAMIFVGIVAYRQAERWVPTVLAMVIGILLGAACGRPLHWIGKAIQRRWYDSSE